jgi:hypothetical protein
MDKEQLKQSRYFLKDSIRKKIKFKFRDQNQGIAAPPVQEKCLEGARRIDLPGLDQWEHIAWTDLTCAIAAYDQEELDELLGLDGDEAFAVYLAPVGKIKAR